MSFIYDILCMLNYSELGTFGLTSLIFLVSQTIRDQAPISQSIKTEGVPSNNFILQLMMFCCYLYMTIKPKILKLINQISSEYLLLV